MKIIKGSELIFISIIRPSGLGVQNVQNQDMSVWFGDDFYISPLSLSEGTYIAQSMYTFVVKLK